MNIEHLCNMVDYAIDGKARTLAGMVIDRVLVVTVNNGYEANGDEIKQICRLIDWPCVYSFPGAVVVDGTGIVADFFVVTIPPPPFINPRLSLKAN